MPERNLDFDTVITRRGTDSLKYDFARRRGKPENVLPLWVADMDFRTSSYIQDALKEVVEHGIWGYSEVDADLFFDQAQTQPGYFKILQDWMRKRHRWEIDPHWLVKTPGIVYALAMAVKAFTKPGDGVLIQQPVYYPFSEVISDNGRKIVNSPLVYDRDRGKYSIDFTDFEEQIVKNDVRLFLLCNPHNPVGRVWTKEELTALGDLCLKHHVLIVSDEIHADFIFEREHTVLANLKKAYEEITVTCTSPSKTFNLAGLQISNILIPNRTLRNRFRQEVNASGFSQMNLMGLAACKAAYRYGEEWLSALLAYLRGNLDFVQRYLKEHIPQIRMVRPEGTYLVWLDFKDLNLSAAEQERLVVEKAGLWLDSGAIFGDAGKGFERINIACPRKTLTTALRKLADAVKKETVC